MASPNTIAMRERHFQTAVKNELTRKAQAFTDGVRSPRRLVTFCPLKALRDSKVTALQARNFGVPKDIVEANCFKPVVSNAR